MRLSLIIINLAQALRDESCKWPSTLVAIARTLDTLVLRKYPGHISSSVASTLDTLVHRKYPGHISSSQVPWTH